MTIEVQLPTNMLVQDGKLVLDAKANEVSDGYHTFLELYEHRHILYLSLMASHPELSWKSVLHSDGGFYPGYFIAGMNLPTGQISYHLPEHLWEACVGVRHERAPEWDGHTSNDVIERLMKFIVICAGR